MTQHQSSAPANSTADLLTMVAAAIIAAIALSFTAGYEIDAANLAKGDENTSRSESWDGRPYTAFTVEGIKAIIEERSIADIPTPCTDVFHTVLWLGNSQLHYINQYREGDHLAPYWLRMEWKMPACIEPLGCSLPNANLQEFLILSRYAAIKMPIDLLILELVFDDMREDDLRRDFSQVLSFDVAAKLRENSSAAGAIIDRFAASQKGAEQGETKEGGLGTVQEHAEKWLNESLSGMWHLWAKRRDMESAVFVWLYNFRNAALGIKPTTVRRMIQSRYDMNMAALRDTLDDYNRRGIPVLLYIAPIRQDKTLPYDISAYNRWKESMGALSDEFGARLLNLETLVPGDLWGSYVGEEIDFMHFQGQGHRIVAEALLPHVRKILEERAR
jgi:hypothetical protein